MKVVINASPIIVLSGLKLMDQAVSLFDELIIPNGVKKEIINGPEDEASKWMRNKGNEFVKTIDNIEALNKQGFRISKEIFEQALLLANEKK